MFHSVKTLRKPIIYLILIAIFRIILSQAFPLTADEAYYWLWSKHLDLSYVDHPPMIAYLNFLFTQGKENLLLLRLGGVLIAFLASLLIYFLAKQNFNEKTAFFCVITFNLIPHFLIIWLTMFVEIPLVLLWTFSLLILSQILKNKFAPAWYLLGITVGLGCLSKYTMFLFPLCLCLCLCLSPEHRFWLKRKEPYLSLLTSLLFFLPVIYWNSAHNWISFTFHAGRASTETWGINFLPFLGDQLIHFSPFLIVLLIPALIKAYKEKSFLFYFSAPILILFTLLSLKIKIWPHWTSAGYIAAIPLTVNYLSEKANRIFISSLAVFSGLVLIVVFFISPAISLHQNDYAQNSNLSDKLQKNLKLYAFNHATVSILEFYIKKPVYLAPQYLRTSHVWSEKQFEIFGVPKISIGETVIYFGQKTPEFETLAEKSFLKVTPIENLKFYFFEDYLNQCRFYRLENYRDY